MQPFPQPSTSYQHHPERHQQIYELTQQVSSCRALNKDQSLFEVPIRLRDGRSTTLRISLPPNFPQGRPSLNVTSVIAHGWVDVAGRLSFASLQNWSPAGSSLAAVVLEACAALSSGPASPQRPGVTSHPISSNSPGSSPTRQGASPPTKAPPVPRNLPELQALTAEELAALLVDDGKYRKLALDIMAKSQIEQVKAQARRQTAELAAANLAKEGTIAELRNQIAIIRSSEYAAAKEAFDDRLRRQQAVLAKLQPEALIAKLAKLAAAADEESERLYDSFIANELPLEGFMDSYIKLRTLYHERELKRQTAPTTVQ
ncbi:hypothetical protein WJX72_007678 [[Myrmecia] bisecta]|uniref:VPS37 C-terminal domain-containing protein n=1 Tax=[Myrmecia] bisecta TaxID=41462 RepID=A0AAW1P5K5_9CHLO